MPDIRFIAMPTEEAERLRAGGPDANGQVPERRLSDGDGVPCRHCLEHVAAGEAYLVLAYRPFDTVQPYAEVGPVFLHAEACRRHPATDTVPPALESPHYMVRGYDGDERIVYGTGRIVPTDRIAHEARALLARDDVSYLHVRSAANNCYQCRIEPV